MVLTGRKVALTVVTSSQEAEGSDFGCGPQGKGLVRGKTHQWYSYCSLHVSACIRF
jgi:hypothetical protein